MFIQTETTPNPRTLKFLPGVPVTGGGSADFTSLDDARLSSPLAARLLAADGVGRVFLADDWLAVTAADPDNWELLKPEILGLIMDHFLSGQETLIRRADSATEDDNNSDSEGAGEDESEVAKQVRELLDLYVRPAVAQDGGDIIFHGFDKGVVYLHMRGACAGCPSSTATLKMGIERLLRHHIADVTEVRAVAG
ncbi:MAG: NifU family protein [Alphaproteobacteria bacterium]|nr:NifU family protein [Alphaproteobacteria bacterium]MDA7986937.1 NifU family protein [Alphaproteobacteria bacterium]